MNQTAYDYQSEALLKGVRVTYSIKHLPCSNPSCLTCMTGMGHGPYWYASYILDGQKKTVFLGRKFKPLDMSVVIKSLHKAKDPNSTTSDFTQKTSQDSNSRAESLRANSEKSELNKSEPNQTESNRARPVNSETQKANIASAGVKKRSTFSLQNAFPRLPERKDFDQDLRLLKGAATSSNLKYVYRKLIKKYHPDQFAGNSQMDRWLSEINSLYKDLQ
ncbi:MAG: hypothetical protein QNL04_01785 [SAR324 cluster bacterium]|nr:hypothetical protein [SAR324 cluster bacterium]